MKKIALSIVSILILMTAAPAQQAGASPKAGGAATDAGGGQASPLKAPGGLVVNVTPPGGAAAPPVNPACAESPALSLAVVIKGRANLRGRANIAGDLVGGVEKGSVLVIEAEDGPGSPWYRVTDVRSGKAGWIHGDSIKVAYRR